MIIALHVENLAVSRGERAVFSGLDLTVAKGRALALTGANGAGKTSLLRAIAGLIQPEAGQVRFDGADGEMEAETARTTQLHMLGHYDGLKGGRTAREELLFQTRWTGGDRQSALAAAEQLEITRLLDLEVRKLSAGQRRRLALARLLASPRSLWLLDEPMAPLDTAQRARFAGVLETHLANGGLLVAAVHDPLPIPCTELRVGA